MLSNKHGLGYRNLTGYQINMDLVKSRSIRNLVTGCEINLELVQPKNINFIENNNC